MIGYFYLFGAVAIGVIFQEQLTRIGEAVGQCIGEFIVSLILGPNGD